MANKNNAKKATTAKMRALVNVIEKHDRSANVKKGESELVFSYGRESVAGVKDVLMGVQVWQHVTKTKDEYHIWTGKDSEFAEILPNTLPEGVKVATVKSELKVTGIKTLKEALSLVGFTEKGAKKTKPKEKTEKTETTKEKVTGEAEKTA